MLGEANSSRLVLIFNWAKIMESVEAVDRMNKVLADKYGIDSDTGRVMYRIVWADDQREMRASQDSNGIWLPPSEELKYPWLRGKYVLENLVLVPFQNEKQLPGLKQSYEVIWPFEDKNLNPLPPRLDAACFVIDMILAVKGKGSLKKYVEEGKESRVDKIVEELYGDETSTTDAMSYGSGVTVGDVNYETEH